MSWRCAHISERLHRWGQGISAIFERIDGQTDAPGRQEAHSRSCSIAATRERWSAASGVTFSVVTPACA